MQQSNVIFGALLIAYIVFITLRGELPTYLTLLRGGGAIANTSGSTTSPVAQVTSTSNNAAQQLTSDPFAYIQGSEGIMVNSSSLQPPQ